MKKKVVWQRILLVFIALTLGLSVYTVNARLSGELMPMPLGCGTAVVLSGSMEPALSVNDVVIVKKCSEYVPGDVVVYVSGRELIIHRIIAIDGENVTTQGDANNTPDEVFPMTAVKGKMIMKMRGMGRAIEIVGSPAGITATLILAAGLFLLSNRREKAEDEAELEKLREEIERLRAEHEGNGTDEK